MARDLQVDTNISTILDLVSRVEEMLACQASDPRQRMLVALAGVPGSGKSTVSHAVLTELTSRDIHDVAIVPMDGFHFTQKKLSTFPDPAEAFRRRGAPFTFDAEGCVKLVKVLQTTAVTAIDEPELLILAPSFDHALKDPVANDIFVSSRTRLVIVEGNYTLLDEHPWSEIAKACHERWFVDAPVDIVRTRLARRHLAAGIETSMDAGIQRANQNDIPNGALIRSRLIEPDVHIKN